MAEPVWRLPRLRRLAQRHLTRSGRFVLAAGVGSAVLGLDPFYTQLALLFAVTVGIAAVGLGVGTLLRPRREGEWHLPARAVAGGSVAATVSLENRGFRTWDVEAAFPGLPEGLSLPDPPRVEVLPRGGRAELRAVVSALRRGAYTVPAPYAGTTYPFGVFRFGRSLRGARRLLVSPRIHPVGGLGLDPGMRHQPGGVPLASRTGESMEFVGAREYRRGDSLRKIHWKLWARRGEPVVREYAQEYFARVGIILDTYLPRSADRRTLREVGDDLMLLRGNRRSRDRFEAAAEVAASVADHLAAQEAIVDFFAAGPEVFHLSAGRHVAPLQTILDVLACVERSYEPGYGALETQLGQLLPRLSAVLVVTFDLEEPRRSFLERLRMSGAPLRVLAVGPPGPPLPGVTWIDPSRVREELSGR